LKNERLSKIIYSPGHARAFQKKEERERSINLWGLATGCIPRISTDESLRVIISFDSINNDERE